MECRAFRRPYAALLVSVSIMHHLEARFTLNGLSKTAVGDPAIFQVIRVHGLFVPYSGCVDGGV